MLKSKLLTSIAGLLFLIGMNQTALATSNIVYQSANYVDESSAIGSYIVDATDFVGAKFTLSSDTDISEIGANFTQFGDGNNIFAAIVADGSWSNIASNNLGHVLFTPNGGDQFATFSSAVHLAAGTYDIVFGSGLFGATGYSGLVDSQDASDIASLFQSTNSGASITALSGTPVRIMVAAVPEPESYAMLLTGLLLTGIVVLRRKTQ